MTFAPLIGMTVIKKKQCGEAEFHSMKGLLKNFSHITKA